MYRYRWTTRILLRLTRWLWSAVAVGMGAVVGMIVGVAGWQQLGLEPVFAGWLGVLATVLTTPVLGRGLLGALPHPLELEEGAW